MKISGYDVEVIKKNIKYMHLYVLPPDGRLRVTAPLFTSKSHIEDFVISKTDWIEKKRATVLQKVAELPEKAEYVTGEIFRYWGQDCTLDVRKGEKNSLALKGNQLVLTVKHPESRDYKEKAVKEILRETVKKAAVFYIRKWEDVTGYRCSSLQIRDMKSRWGSCSTHSKKIRIALRLVHYPPECLEYVVLHELTHTEIPNHSLGFKSVLTRYMPEWKSIEKMLK